MYISHGYIDGLMGGWMAKENIQLTECAAFS